MSPEDFTGSVQQGVLVVEYRASKARYAKNSIVVRTLSTTGYKSPVDWMCEAMGARFSNREKAYVLPASKANTLRRALSLGWTAKRRYHADDVTGFYAPGSETCVSFKDMKASLAKQNG